MKLPLLKLPPPLGLSPPAGNSSGTAAPGLESRAISVGFAANGGKASARAAAHVQQPASSGGLVAALANATAVANHASHTLAVSKSGAGNMAHVGTTVADTTAEAYADHLSSATADSGSRSMGRGGDSTSAGTTTRSVATDGSSSVVAGTAVSSAGGQGGTAHVISESTGTAQQHGHTRTRADSITVGVDSSAATGTAKSTASSQQHGRAVSHSLMESFSLFGSKTDANSLATARGSSAGLAASRDKAVGIGLWSAQAATNTSTEVVSAKLGLAVVTSVVRSITAQGRLACADAIRRAAAELSTGPQLNINDVTLHLGGKVPQQCLTSYKDLAVTALRRIKAEQQAADPVTEAGSQAQDFERLRGSVLAGMGPGLQAAAGKVQDALNALKAG